MANNKQGHNSFYQEKTSKNRTNIDWKQVPKWTLKGMKWMFFLFLAITTLWGCVQEFIITTSPFLTQGMETYLNSDEVIPNLYFVSEDFTYENETKTAEGKIEPFANILYPKYQVNDDKTWNYDSIEYVNFADAKAVIDNKDDDLSASVPKTMVSSLSMFSIETITSLLFINQQQAVVNISGQDKYEIPYSQVIDGTSHWFVHDAANAPVEVDNLLALDLKKDDKDYSKVQNIKMSIFYVNLYGYLNASIAQASDVILSDGTPLNEYIDTQIASIENSETKSKYNGLYGSNSYQTLDYQNIFSTSFGVSLFVRAQKKNDQKVPSEAAEEYIWSNIDDIRDPNWNNAPVEQAEGTHEYKNGEDESISNAGWIFLNNDGDLVNLTNGASEVPLYAQKIVDGLGDPSANSIEAVNNEAVANDYTYSCQKQLLFSVSGEKENLEVNYEIDSKYKGFVKQQSKAPDLADSYDSIYVGADQSIEATGQTRYNNDRIALDSWKEAWSYGPFYGLFVYPISIIANWVSKIIPYDVLGGWSVLISVFIIVFAFRGLAALISLRSTRNSNKMQELQVKIAQINAKYDMYKDNKNMKQRKQMEIMALYRKEGVNPLSSFGNLFLTLPIFLAMWTIISTFPIYKIAAFGQFYLSVSPFFGIFNLFIQSAGLYLIVGVTVGLIQFMSYKLPTWLAQKREGLKNIDDATKKQMKKSSKVMNIMMVVFIFIGLTIPTLLSIYWIFSSLFTITQNLIQHGLKERKTNKEKRA